MSLGRLLATGKSLVGGQNSMGRYHLNKQMGLPKFVSPRNPFATDGKTEAAPQSPVVAEQPLPLPKAAAARETGEEIPKRVSRRSIVSRLTLAIRNSGEWLRRVNPLLHLAKLAKPKRTAIPQFTKPPVQSELCLDNVHVVRNDLSDADLEVVPIAPVGSKPESAVIDRCETAGGSWDRLTTRMFG